MPVTDSKKAFRGRKSKLGSVFVTAEDHKVAFFVAYCPHGSKIGLTPEEAQAFALRFGREKETKMQRIISAPERTLRGIFTTMRAARRIAHQQRLVEDRI